MHSRSLGRLIVFLKATIVGGLFVLVPVVLISIVIGQAAQFAYEVVHPLVQWLPVKSVSGVSLSFLIGLIALALLCFLAGLLARTAVSRWFVGTLEQLIVSFVPGYALMKSMGQGWVGVEEKTPHQAVLVRFDDVAQLGFVMDTLPDSRHVVFVPDVPNPWSGTLLFVTPDRIEPLAITTKQAIDCLRHLGANTSKILSTVKPAG
ncbi:hypothetical protein ETAA8_51990 [Anatilimnocola aggregata]|uniref:DUF502 domain-containing protein n=1 Tax=Anatilimnocola aggregata TaxID=2528021 RepID=A0A517YIM9_9BACT|nr:DUF502 domain-containing protein [Anatilimnocola aggregata]QDU30080.1 hypothetical protein ETAA8_51990 [Anatilimnocola aggregata]